MSASDKTLVMNSRGDDFRERCPVCGMAMAPDSDDSSSLRCPVCSYLKVQKLVFEPGASVGNKYKILSHLNSGGCGDLYLCCPLDDFKTRYVLKVLKQTDSAGQSRFHREAMILSSIRHQHIAAVLDFWESGEESFIVMEFITGDNLRELQKKFDFGEETSLMVIQRVTEALQYIWENFSIIHRDIKPENIMINDQMEVKLLDFGLSKQLSSQSMTEITLEKVGLGTPGYMSPEQFLDSKHVDFRSDIFSLGATLFFLVVGEKPFSGTTNQEIYKDTLRNSPPPQKRMTGKCSDECAELICFMMQQKPENRPQSYSELLEKVNKLLS